LLLRRINKELIYRNEYLHKSLQNLERGAYFEYDREMYLWLIELYSEVMKLSKLLNADF